MAGVQKYKSRPYRFHRALNPQFIVRTTRVIYSMSFSMQPRTKYEYLINLYLNVFTHIILLLIGVHIRFQPVKMYIKANSISVPDVCIIAEFYKKKKFRESFTFLFMQKFLLQQKCSQIFLIYYSFWVLHRLLMINNVKKIRLGKADWHLYLINCFVKANVMIFKI